MHLKFQHSLQSLHFRSHFDPSVKQSNSLGGLFGNRARALLRMSTSHTTTTTTDMDFETYGDYLKMKPGSTLEESRAKWEEALLDQTIKKKFVDGTCLIAVAMEDSCTITTTTKSTVRPYSYGDGRGGPSVLATATAASTQGSFSFVDIEESHSVEYRRRPREEYENENNLDLDADAESQSQVPSF